MFYGSRHFNLVGALLGQKKKKRSLWHGKNYFTDDTVFQYHLFFSLDVCHVYIFILITHRFLLFNSKLLFIIIPLIICILFSQVVYLKIHNLSSFYVENFYNNHKYSFRKGRIFP